MTALAKLPRDLTAAPPPRDLLRRFALLASEMDPAELDDLAALVDDWLSYGRFRGVDLAVHLGVPAIGVVCVDPAAERLRLLHRLAEPFTGLDCWPRAEVIVRLARRYEATAWRLDRVAGQPAPGNVELFGLHQLALSHPVLKWPLGQRRIFDLLNSLNSL